VIFKKRIEINHMRFPNRNLYPLLRGCICIHMEEEEEEIEILLIEGTRQYVESVYG
jgi:hypothetical protein